MCESPHTRSNSITREFDLSTASEAPEIQLNNVLKGQLIELKLSKIVLVSAQQIRQLGID